MATREEIREGIDIALRLGTGKTGEELEVFKQILSILGVVLKVEGDLPKNPYPELEKGIGRSRHYARVRHFVYNESQKMMLKKGYTAWEPLIGEK